MTALAARVFCAEHAAIWLLRPEGAWLISQFGSSADLEAEALDRHRRVAAEGKPLFFSEPPAGVRGTPDFAGDSIGFYAGVPLHDPNGVIVGVLAAYDRGRIGSDANAPVMFSDLAALAEMEVHTAIRQAEAAARLERSRVPEGAALHAALLESARSAIVATDAAGHIVFWNRFSEELFGWKAGEALGRSVTALAVAQKYQQLAHEVITRLRQPGHWKGELLARRKDGKTFRAQVLSSTYTSQTGAVGGVVSIWSDITELRQREETLTRANRNLQTILQSSPLAIVALDLEGKVRIWNPAAERLFGWTESEALNEALRIVPPDLISEIRPMLDHNGSGDVIAGGEEQRVRKDGTRIDVCIWTAPLRDGFGGVSGSLRIFLDVTDRKRLQERVMQSQKMEAIGHLAGAIAHDFNNLLTVVSGYGEILKGKLRANSPLNDDVDAILEAANRGAALTRQLLIFSRRQVVRPRTVDLNRSMLRSEKLFRRVVREDINLELAVNPEPLTIKVDPSQVDQVAMNLVVNAAEAMPRGGTISITTHAVELREDARTEGPSLPPGWYAVLTVSDTGAGMDAETRKHLFEPFFTTKAKGKGTGLGLSTVYGIVRQSAGDVLVESEPGRGSTFRIYWPLLQTSAVTAEEQTAPRQRHKGTETILLVEDEEGVRRLVKRVLERRGYKVIAAANAEDALRRWERRKGRFDLLLTDVIMPNMSGSDLARKLEALNPALKIMYMSGYAHDVVSRHGVLREGINFIPKPFEAEQLSAKVREILDNPKAATIERASGEGT